MTAMLERQGRTKQSSKTALSGGLPQVNLLPPEIRAARSLRVAKRYLVLLLAAVALACALGYVGALLSRSDANALLSEAQSRTAQLQTEQNKYAEVPTITSALTQSENAASATMGDEVLWAPYLSAFTAVLPAGVTVDTVAITALADTETDGTSSASATDQLASFAFTVRSPSVPDTAALLDALSSVTGFTDPFVQTVSFTANQSGGASYYSVSGTVTVTSAALSHRFTEGSN